MSDAVTRARELLAKATPGPWEVDGLEGNLDAPSGRVAEVLLWGEPDAELIAAAPTLLAELADEVDQLRTRLDAVVAIHSDRNGDCAECEMSTGQGVDWPCWTYNAAMGVES